MTGPWSAEEIAAARRVKFGTVLDYPGEHCQLPGIMI